MRTDIRTQQCQQALHRDANVTNNGNAQQTSLQETVGRMTSIWRRYN